MNQVINSQNSIENLESLVMRTLSGDKKAEFYFKKSNVPSLNGQLLSFPQADDTTAYDFCYIRGVVDSVSMQLKYHNKDVFDEISLGKDRNTQEILSNAEKARCELLGVNKYLGVKSNITNMVENEFETQDYTQLKQEKCFIKALYLQILLSNSDIELPYKISNFISDNNKNIPIDETANLKNSLHNQQDFLKSVLNIIAEIDSANDSESKSEKENKDAKKEDVNIKNNASKNDKPEEQQETESQQEPDEEQKKEKKSPIFKSGQDIDLKKEKSANSSINISSYDNNDFPTIKHKYRVYTKKYDEVIEANNLCSPEELNFLNRIFQEKTAKLTKISNKDINKFIRTLVAVTNKWWKNNIEDGRIDHRKFPIIIANPNFQEYFKQQQVTKDNNTIVSLLLDNSGSMRGKPISVTAMSCDIIARILEKFAIKTEILGFTTSKWRGGDARKDWELKGSPKNPGRLNDVRHVIYKSADVPFVKARKNLSLMMKDGLLKENIDGEAILWAAARLQNYNYARKILIVISDGAPVDDSTTASNTHGYLDSHLKEVIEHVQTKTDIEISAIGIGHDVTKYYKNSIKIKDVEDLNKTMFNELARVLKVS